MTILDSKSLLFNHFSSHHSFEMGENFIDLIPITATKELDTAILISALEDMEKAELIRKLSVEGISIWVLTQSLENFSQQVQIGRATSSALTALLGLAAEQLKNEELISDPTNIKEKDIQNILILLQNSLKK